MNQRFETSNVDKGASTSVRLTVTGPHPREAVMEWMEDLPADELGVRGRDGWIVQEVSAGDDTAVVDITAAGEALCKGADEAFDVLDALGCELAWEERPQE
ncbi:hypothetical protein [Corynebacterium qintianiae]|uniref:hypothetical protein n=1 Tax=Corynebacterium qintianiae TaxID=2709392 RepID=UPI0013EC725D|nr:hypothetical protein [Corynebacterium qintianiae]